MFSDLPNTSRRYFKYMSSFQHESNNLIILTLSVFLFYCIDNDYYDDDNKDDNDDYDDDDSDDDVDDDDNNDNNDDDDDHDDGDDDDDDHDYCGGLDDYD